MLDHMHVCMMVSQTKGTNVIGGEEEEEGVTSLIIIFHIKRLIMNQAPGI